MPRFMCRGTQGRMPCQWVCENAEDVEDARAQFLDAYKLDRDESGNLKGEVMIQPLENIPGQSSTSPPEAVEAVPPEPIQAPAGQSLEAKAPDVQPAPAGNETVAEPPASSESAAVPAATPVEALLQYGVSAGDVRDLKMAGLRSVEAVVEYDGQVGLEEVNGIGPVGRDKILAAMAQWQQTRKT